MGLFNVERSSVYYTDKKIKKLRIISGVLSTLGILSFVILFLTWKDEYSEIEVEGISTFFKMPFILIIIAFVLFIVSGIFHYIAVGKSIVKEIKSDDNPFLNK